MASNSSKLRKRIYEILLKLARGETTNFSAQNFSTNNEMVELIEILTNQNPYLDISPVQIGYSEIIDGDPNVLGAYYTNNDVIIYSTRYIESIAKNETNIMMLFDTIFHEQRHHYQDFFRKNSSLIDSIDFKKAADGILDGRPNENEIKELNNFANKHNLISRLINRTRLKILHFAAYLSNQCEVDARKNSYNATKKVFEEMISDPMCPQELKKYLIGNFNLYEKHHKSESKKTEKLMKDYMHLDNRVKESLLKSVRAGKRLKGETYTALLNGIMDHITKNLTLKDNLEIAKWAMSNNYSDLLPQINLRNSLDFEKRDLSHFITDVISDHTLNSENFSSVLSLFSTFSQKENEDAIKYLVENLAYRAEVKILLDNCNIGKYSASFNGTYITSKIMHVALSNYLSKIEATKNIEDYEYFKQIEEDIRKRLDFPLGQEEIKELFEPFIKRIDKINANSEIKINDKKQGNLQPIELTEDNVKYFHFTDTKFLETIQKEGLVPRIGDNALGAEKTEKVFFSEGIDNVAKCIDVWIRWRIVAYNKINTLPKYIEEEFGGPVDVKYYEEHKKLSRHDERRYKEAYKIADKRFKQEIAEGKLAIPEAIAYAYEDMYNCWKNRTYLSLDLTEDSDFVRTDISEDKEQAFEAGYKEYLRYMYGDFEFDSLQMDSWNMHTKPGQGVDPSKIQGVLAADGKTDGLSIAKRIYELAKAKNNGQLDLPDFEKWLAYCHGREVSENKNSDKYLECATKDQKEKLPNLTYQTREITSNDRLRKFIFNGSELDEKLVKAFIQKDTKRIGELIDQGANPNIPITFQEFKETTETEKEEPKTKLELTEESTLPILSQFIVRNHNIQDPQEEIRFIDDCISKGARLSSLDNQYVMPETAVEKIQNDDIREHVEEINESAKRSEESLKGETPANQHKYILEDIKNNVFAKHETKEQSQPLVPTPPSNN